MQGTYAILECVHVLGRNAGDAGLTLMGLVSCSASTTASRRCRYHATKCRFHSAPSVSIKYILFCAWSFRSALEALGLRISALLHKGPFARWTCPICSTTDRVNGPSQCAQPRLNGTGVSSLDIWDGFDYSSHPVTSFFFTVCRPNTQLKLRNTELSIFINYTCRLESGPLPWSR